MLLGVPDLDEAGFVASNMSMASMMQNLRDWVALETRIDAGQESSKQSAGGRIPAFLTLFISN